MIKPTTLLAAALAAAAVAAPAAAADAGAAPALRVRRCAVHARDRHGQRSAVRCRLRRRQQGEQWRTRMPTGGPACARRWSCRSRSSTSTRRHDHQATLETWTYTFTFGGPSAEIVGAARCDHYVGTDGATGNGTAGSCGNQRVTFWINQR